MDYTPRVSHPNRKCDPNWNKEFNHVGKTGLRRRDGWEKVSGTAMFGRDFTFPGTLYARVLACPHANALIKSMDTSKAEVYPGVRRIVRYDDKDHPLIPVWVVPQQGRFEGEPMGVAVIAVSDEVAQDALRMIDIEWEVLPFVLECEDALKEGAPLCYNLRSMTSPSNPSSNRNTGPTGAQVGPVGNKLGDVQQGFEEADKIIEFTTYKAENHARVEPMSGSFVFKEDHLEAACPGQLPAKALAMNATGALNAYDHPIFHGGAFGHGYPISLMFGFLGGVLSKIMNGTPVKILMDTSQSNFYCMSNDAGFEKFKIGFKNDGTITAVQTDSHYNQTTYECGVTHMEENTRIPNLLTNYEGAWVNRPTAFCCRSEQRVAAAGLNLTFSHVAAELEMDPTELALKNDGVHGHGMEFIQNLKREQGFPDRDSLAECVAVAKQAIDFDNVWHKAGTKTLPDGRKHGLAFSWDHSWTDMTFDGAVLIVMSPGSGMTAYSMKAEISGQFPDHGLNAATSYCQLAAEEIGLNISDVYFKPNTEGHGIELQPPASASGMSVNGWAIIQACRQLKAQILHLAVNGPEMDIYPTYEVPNPVRYEPYFPGKQPEDLDIKDGYVFEKANPDNRAGVGDVCQNKSATTAYHAPLAAWGWYNAGNWGAEHPHRARMVRNAHFTEVAVDAETGDIEVLRVVNVNDVGKAITPESVKGQMYGGTIMGISRGKYEASIYDPNTGVKLNADLLQYMTSTIDDCGPIDTRIVETATGYGPYGLVGVAECCADILPSSIGPAVQNAIGVWIDDYPITPDKVLKALGKA